MSRALAFESNTHQGNFTQIPYRVFIPPSPSPTTNSKELLYQAEWFLRKAVPSPLVTIIGHELWFFSLQPSFPKAVSAESLGLTGMLSI